MKPANPYLKTKIMTASPEELRLMLYEGAIRFCLQSKEALVAKNYEQSYNGLMRAQKIVLELSTSLNHQVDPELCTRLGTLYTYIYRRLVDASLYRQIDPVDEALKLLEYEHQTWKLLMKKLAEDPEAAEVADRGRGRQGAQQTAISSLSING